MPLQIIIEKDDTTTVEHAKAYARVLYDARGVNTYEPNSKGVALHLAQCPTVCDDCGEDYWARNEYAAHRGCKGEKKNNSTGF